MPRSIKFQSSISANIVYNLFGTTYSILIRYSRVFSWHTVIFYYLQAFVNAIPSLCDVRCNTKYLQRDSKGHPSIGSTHQ